MAGQQKTAEAYAKQYRRVKKNIHPAAQTALLDGNLSPSVFLYSRHQTENHAKTAGKRVKQS
jgi:hypothetical protein